MRLFLIASNYERRFNFDFTVLGAYLKLLLLSSSLPQVRFNRFLLNLEITVKNLLQVCRVEKKGRMMRVFVLG